MQASHVQAILQPKTTQLALVPSINVIFKKWQLLLHTSAILLGDS